MIIEISKLEDFKNSGVYKIINTVNGKFYIGSTIMTMLKRIEHHYHCLINNKHKNKHLQYAWNKYGADAFKAEVIVIVDKFKTLEKEQEYINQYINTGCLYNINPLASGTPNLLPEVIKKRAATMKRRYASGEIISHFKGKQTWNKGLTKKDFDYSYLKVPKTITKTLINSRESRKNRMRNETYPKIYVYNLDKNYLGTWRSSKELEEWSITDNNNLPISSRFKKERMGKPIKFLQSVNINKSCKTGNSYKGLLFSYKPLHQVIDVEKLDKFGETPVMDNTEPTINLND